ncbi:MAG: MFS transporter [Candidatus Nitricoxidivorans perseverans]|uniref:MFS transporter n=1 Tax=Candidatus Nitricoxidivorans perseverans TaxID=2975601 RepID=A0AA49IY58_9PROT|nr:MAG: MFS transporter [Candidatus Nitricoxidivorans perseverans]
MTSGAPPYWRLSAWYFFYFAFIGVFAPYFTLYLQSLALTGWDIGVLMSLMQVMRMLAPNLWGALADRLGRRTAVVRLAAALSATGALVFLLARDFWGLFAGMAILAFFWSASLPLVEALTLDHLADRSDRYGRIRLWGSVGFIAAVLGAGAWLDAAPLSSLPVLILAMLLGIAACAWRLPEAPSPPHRESTPMRATLRRPEVLALLAACFFMAAAHGPFYVFYSIHLVDHGYGKTAIGAFWSLGVVAEIAAFMLMPRMMRVWSIRAILMASFVLAVIRFLLIGWHADSIALLLLAQLMHGATFGAYHAAAVAALNRWFSARHQAHAQALYGSISFGAGGMLGNIASGQAWESLGPGPTYTLGSAFAAVGLLLVWRGLSRRPVR